MIDVAKGKKSSCLALKISKKLWKKLIILSNNEKTLCDYPVQSEQNKPISGHIPSTKKNVMIS